jgi:hypothetical protein
MVDRSFYSHVTSKQERKQIHNKCIYLSDQRDAHECGVTGAKILAKQARYHSDGLRYEQSDLKD